MARDARNDRLATEVGKEIAAYHAGVPVIRRPDRVLIADILSKLGRVFDEFPGAAATERVAEWREAATARRATVGQPADRDGAGAGFAP